MCYTERVGTLVGVEVDVAKLRELRKRRVLTLRELGAVAGVSYNTVWRLENGFTEARPSTIRKLAAALDVESTELVRLEHTDG